MRRDIRITGSSTKAVIRVHRGQALNPGNARKLIKPALFLVTQT